MQRVDGEDTVTHSFYTEIQVGPPSATHCSAVENGKWESCIFEEDGRCLVFWADLFQEAPSGKVRHYRRCQACLNSEEGYRNKGKK